MARMYDQKLIKAIEKQGQISAYDYLQAARAAGGELKGTMTKIPAEGMEQAINKIDMCLRPTVVFMHPDVFEAIKQQMPDIEDRMVIYTNIAIEKDKIYAMSRETFEDYTNLNQR